MVQARVVMDAAATEEAFALERDRRAAHVILTNRVGNFQEIAMAKLTFYRQIRQDAGSRLGLVINNVLRLMDFSPGSTEEPDPALSWYLDVRCEGAGVPADPEQARDWLLRHASHFQQGLHRFADELRAGIDTDIYPVQRVMPNPPADATVKLFCSAMRRLKALHIAEEIDQTAQEWDALLNKLAITEAVGV